MKKTLNNKIFKNEKGSTLSAVIITLAILMILGAALMQSSTTGLKTSKHEETTEMAYYAAQSGLEKCFSFIENYCSIRSNTNGIAYSDEEDFAIKVLDKIMTDLQAHTNTKYGVSSTKAIFKIGLSSNASDSAEVEIRQIKYLGYTNTADQSIIEVTYGVTAVADYIKTGDTASNKTIFAKNKVKMSIPRDFKLNAAIYSIGDLMVENINTQIEGDIIVYGTSPQFSKQPEQYYYGGIYARKNGHLSVMGNANSNGNAYSRSLIRTGEYGSLPDSSSIYIYGDAIANGIQVFGKGEKIVVGKNAYTFDDLEMNGEDSVIAINGNYLGLTNDTTESAIVAHDQSSAIVNSAIIHYSGSDESLRSRIVINGDAIVNGGTFRIDSITGNIDSDLPQIEDASVVIKSSFNTPMYKEYLDNPLFGDSSFPAYHNWLFRERSLATGFANLIQCWKPRAFTDDNSIKDWTDLIDNARGAGTNNSAYFDPDVDLSSISGFCHYELGANDKIYFMSAPSVEIEPFRFITTSSSISIDNVVSQLSYGWSGFLNGLPGSRSDWKSLSSIDTPITSKLKDIRKLLVDKTEVFCKRTYIYNLSGASPVVNEFKNAPSRSSSGNAFLHIKDYLISNFSGMSGTAKDAFIINFSGYTPDQTINVNDGIDDRVTANSALSRKYFLVINPDPSIKLVINRPLNGIIFSMGKVIIQNGGQVNGAILAAGNGFSSDTSDDTDIQQDYVLTNKSSADQDTSGGTEKYYLPQILENGRNLDKLDGGSYAGVHFFGYSSSDSAYVRFPGRDILLQEFMKIDNGEINLKNIF